MSSRFSSEQLKAEANSLGFFACGIAKAAPVEPSVADAYRQWIAQGGHADMHYLENNMEKRLDPTLLLEGANSIIVVALNYAPARRIPEDEYQLAVYAYGKDYHDVLKDRLRHLIQHSTFNNQNSKIATDTVPILERYWAQQAGIGFIGRNRQLIIPQAGSMFFLGEIITTAEFDHYDTPMENRCGTCHRCLDACPTGALSIEHSTLNIEHYDADNVSNSSLCSTMVNAQWSMLNGQCSMLNGQCSMFNSKKCLSYQTIENRGEIDESVKDKLGNTIYGCDRCQQVCPWNRFAIPTDIPELQPSDALLSMKRDDWQHLSLEDYQRLFKGSAVKRAKYEGLMRNIKTMKE